jgi:hypothetical protein
MARASASTVAMHVRQLSDMAALIVHPPEIYLYRRT